MGKNTRTQRKVKARHRAHKRDSLPLKPTGIGRDARHAEKREARKAQLAPPVAEVA